MAEKKNDGGPAFPMTRYHNTLPVEDVAGMSLRDWFAGQAPWTSEGIAKIFALHAGDRDGLHAAIAEASYSYADAMLKERAK